MYLTCACTTVDSDLYGMSSQRLDLHLGLSEENPFTHSREEELSSDSTGGPKEVREFEMEIVDTRNDVDLGIIISISVVLHFATLQLGIVLELVYIDLMCVVSPNKCISY